MAADDDPLVPLGELQHDLRPHDVRTPRPWRAQDGRHLHAAPAERLTAFREPLDLPSQLVHGDLSSNVLFHDSEPPAIMDLSLDWCPVPYAEAIVTIDAFLCHLTDLIERR